MEVKGAPDRAIRVAAEYWYLYYTFGLSWTPGMPHGTEGAKEGGAHFSARDIQILPDTRKRVYFRLPW